MKKADYKKIAASYDKGRSLPEESIKIWLSEITTLGELREGSKILDLGCGTGRFALPFAQHLKLHVVAVDASAEMLARGKQKDKEGQVEWQQEDAQQLSFADENFDCVFMSHLLHHVNDKQAVMNESFRVLKKGGNCLVRFGSHAQMRRMLEYRFFPEALRLDLARIPDTDEIKHLMRTAGFQNLIVKEISYRFSVSVKDRLAKVRQKHISAYTLIDEEAFEEGYKRLEAYLLEHPDDPALTTEQLTLFCGQKTSG